MFGFCLIVGCSGNPSTTSTSSQSATATPKKNTIRYLAVTGGQLTPKDAVVVADEKTMIAIKAAAKSQNRSLYNKLASSKAASLIQGGSIVTIVQKKGELVEVELHSRDINDVDLSGQRRWTDASFIHERQI
jgi:threonine dehydrogenase-like Zn-dependent dehydrogenase